MSKKFIGGVLGLFVLTGAAFFAMLRWGSELAPLGGGPGPGSGAAAPAVPKTPHVGLTVHKSSKGNTLLVAWENLPGNTAALKIFRSTKGKDNWSLWKTIPIAPGDLGNGSVEIGIGNATFSDYSFYIEAVTGGGGNPGTTPGTSNGDVLWASPITDAPVTTSTPPVAPPPSGGTPPEPNPGPAPSSTPSSTPPAQNGSSSESTSSSGGSPPAPTGTPYYTPQLQLSGYGAWQSGSFWVQHTDQKIQLGWQNLPQITDAIMILRSPDENGPWNTILVQENPGVNGAYSIQIVDDTLGAPYYYEMTALAGSSTVATYGPVYLAPL